MGPDKRDQRGERGKELTASDVFWCELVLNGIGGRTIEEAKRNMSYSEAQVWMAYREQTGVLNVGQRVEVSSAAVAQQVNWSIPREKGSTYPPLEAFLPNRGAQAEQEQSPEQASEDLQRAMREW